MLMMPDFKVHSFARSFVDTPKEALLSGYCSMTGSAKTLPLGESNSSESLLDQICLQKPNSSVSVQQVVSICNSLLYLPFFVKLVHEMCGTRSIVPQTLSNF